MPSPDSSELRLYPSKYNAIKRNKQYNMALKTVMVSYLHISPVLKGCTHIQANMPPNPAVVKLRKISAGAISK
jgi:hypothetical protein